MCCCPTMTFSVFGSRRNESLGIQSYSELLDSGESPCRLLGSVWYREDELGFTSSAIGKYTVEDDLEDSVEKYSNQRIISTVTTWGGEVLYVLVPKFYGLPESSYPVEALAAVQRISLPDAEAEWWFDVKDNADILGAGIDGGIYPDPMFSYPWSGITPAANAGVAIVGQPVLDDSGNVRGEQGLTVQSGGVWGKSTISGFGDDGFGAVYGFDGTGSSGEPVYRVAFADVDSDGDLTRTVSGDQIKGGSWERLDSLSWVHEMTDSEFLFTSGFNAPGKVLPLLAASNDWPYGIGAYVETKEVSRNVQTWKWDIRQYAETMEGCMLDAAGTPFESLIGGGGLSVSDWYALLGPPIPAHSWYWWIEGDAAFLEQDHFTLQGHLGSTLIDTPPYPPITPLDPYGEVWFPYSEDGVSGGRNWGCEELGSGMILGTPIPSSGTAVGYFTIDHELGYAKFQYRVTYCIGEIESDEGELPYIETTGQSYSTPWVDYYGGLGNVPAVTGSFGARATLYDWMLPACGYPDKISVKSVEGAELDPIDRYRAQPWPDANVCEGVFDPEWKRVGGGAWEIGAPYNPGNSFGDLGASHSFIGRVRYFNSTSNHSAVFLVDYEREDVGTKVPVYDPVNQEGQTMGYRITPRIVPPEISWTTYQRLVFKDKVIWDSYDSNEVIDFVEVLVGNKIVVISHDGDGPQKLAVWTVSGEVFSINASTKIALGGDLDGDVQGAFVTTCSDRWMYVRNFPLEVELHTDLPGEGQELISVDTVDNLGAPTGHYPTWLISLDGETKVPARLDTPTEIKQLGITSGQRAARIPEAVDSATWAFPNGSAILGYWHYDAPRSSSVIDGVSPGTMDPSTFF